MSRREPNATGPADPDAAHDPAQELVQQAGTLAHDINNLLTAVIGYATLVARSFDEHDQRRVDLNEIVHAAQQAGSLAHEILIMSGRRPRLEGTFGDDMPSSHATAAAKAPQCVLVVDDDRAVRYLVRTILTREGYDVREASSAEAAKAWLAEHASTLRLLISDVVMPGGGGADFFRSAIAANAGLRVLYMSGYSEDEILHEGLLDAGAPFIQKPFSGDDLARKIREVLRIAVPSDHVR